jgi:hypothetical protein
MKNIKENMSAAIPGLLGLQLFQKTVVLWKEKLRS